MSEFGPLPFAWLRVLGAYLLLTLLVPLFPKPAAARDHDSSFLWKCALYSMLGVVVNQLLFLSGLSRTSAHEAALLITTIPVFVMLSAAALRMERITRAKATGIALSCLGAVIIVAQGDLEGGHGSFAGNAMIVINCLSYSLYLVVSRPLFQVSSPIRILRVMFGMGTLLMLPFCLSRLVSLQWREVSWLAWCWLGVVIAGPTVAAYVISGWALARAESSTVAVYTYLQPIFASLMAAALLGEKIGRIVAFAGVLIIAGVYVASRRPARSVPAP